MSLHVVQLDVLDFLAANEPFGVSALIIAIGYLLKRTRVLDESTGEGLARVALNFTLPAILLINVPQIELTPSNALLPAYGILHSLLMVGIGLLVFRGMSRTDKGLALSASSGYNIGLFAIPIVAGVYGSEGIARFALIDVGNILSIFVLSYYLAYRFSPRRSRDSMGVAGTLKMIFSSVPLVAYLIAVAMNLLGLRLGGFAARLVEVPAAMNRGISLLALGILLRFSFPAETWRAIAAPLLLRYSFGIVSATLVLFFAPLPLLSRVAVAGVFVMPVGLTIIPFAVKWGYDRDRAAAILNCGIPVSFVLFWGVWAIGEYALAG